MKRDDATVGLDEMGYAAAPRLLVFADSSAGAARARHAASWLARAAEPLGLEEAAVRLDAQAALDIVFVHLTRDHRRTTDELLRRLEAGAHSGRFPSVVCIPPHLIEVVLAAAPHPDVAILVDPSDSDLLASMSFALAGRSLPRSGVNSETPAQRLKQLSHEVARIAELLARIAHEEAHRSASGPWSGGRAAEIGEEGSQPDPAALRSVIRARRMRDHYFPGGFFADPAWDMLLDLMAARLEQQAVAVSSLCIASSVPPTTALRWIKTLADAGLFVRSADPHDRRRVFIELSEAAAKAMAAYLAAIQRTGAPLL